MPKMKVNVKNKENHHPFPIASTLPSFIHYNSTLAQPDIESVSYQFLNELNPLMVSHKQTHTHTHPPTHKIK